MITEQIISIASTTEDLGVQIILQGRKRKIVTSLLEEN